MINIFRAITMIAAMAVLTFTPAQASARGCGDDKDRTGCSSAAASNPVQLDQFMKTWKPVSVSKSGKRVRSASRTHRSRSHSTVASERKSTGGTKVASDSKMERASKVEPAPAPESEAPVVAAAPIPAVETDGVAVTSFNEVNELDQAAPRIQVVAFNEINEVDLAAPPPPEPVAAETVSQAVSSTPAPADNSWIGKLLLAAAGTIALAGGLRLLAV